MQPSVEWFFGLASIAAAGLVAGQWLGRGSPGRAWAALLVGMGLLATWTYLKFHPSVAVRAIPVDVLCYLEGTAAVPFFMLILGVAWSRARLPKQKRLLVLAAVVGVVFFIQGGFWMLQTTPRTGLASVSTGQRVMQSQDYSCVPASCATALNIMGLPTSEAEMADLTQTRPGTGATVIRAMEGLTERLGVSGIRVRLLEPTFDQLLALPPPVIITVNFGDAARYRHMVVLTQVSSGGAMMADPVDGEFFVPRRALEPAYQGQALVFDRPRAR